MEESKGEAPEDTGAVAAEVDAVELLKARAATVENSIRHLLRSNRELAEEYERDPDEVYLEAMNENEDIVQEKLARLRELRKMMVEAGVRGVNIESVEFLGGIPIVDTRSLGTHSAVTSVGGGGSGSGGSGDAPAAVGDSGGGMVV